MKEPIEKINKKTQFLQPSPTEFEALYDQYAPALYGRILKVIRQKDIAENILEKVFADAMKNNFVNQKHITHFITLLNASRNKAYSTLKAIKILEALSCSYPKDSGKYD